MAIEKITFEKKIVETITVTLDGIKEDYRNLTNYLENKCNLAIKKSPNRPWIYLKNSETLKTIGGVRLNKNSIGTFYLDTNPGTILNSTMLGVVSKEERNFISNRIIVNDLQGLEKVCDLINELMEKGALYTGTRN